MTPGWGRLFKPCWTAGRGCPSRTGWPSRRRSGRWSGRRARDRARRDRVYGTPAQERAPTCPTCPNVPYVPRCGSRQGWGVASTKPRVGRWEWGFCHHDPGEHGVTEPRELEAVTRNTTPDRSTGRGVSSPDPRRTRRRARGETQRCARDRGGAKVWRARGKPSCPRHVFLRGFGAAGAGSGRTAGFLTTPPARSRAGIRYAPRWELWFVCFGRRWPGRERSHGNRTGAERRDAINGRATTDSLDFMA